MINESFDGEKPPPPREFLCWVVSKPRTRRKNNPPEEQPPKLDRFWLFEGGFLFLQVLDLGSPQQRTPPGGEFHTIKLGGVQRTGGSRIPNASTRLFDGRGPRYSTATRLQLVGPLPLDAPSAAICLHRLVTLGTVLELKVLACAIIRH